MDSEVLDKIIADYEQSNFQNQLDAVYRRLESTLNPLWDEDGSGKVLISSMQGRLKSTASLRDKLHRKVNEKGLDISTLDDVTANITDLVGYRIITFDFESLVEIDHYIRSLDPDDWFLLKDSRNPFYRSWDPTIKERLSCLGLDFPEVESKGRYYSGAHYMLKPSESSPLWVELQVRTILEEAWGEIDHMVNYPHPTSDPQIKSQVAALSKVCSAGNDLISAIMKLL